MLRISRARITLLHWIAYALGLHIKYDGRPYGRAAISPKIERDCSANQCMAPFGMRPSHSEGD
jgi:hypothetical protein